MCQPRHGGTSQTARSRQKTLLRTGPERPPSLSGGCGQASGPRHRPVGVEGSFTLVAQLCASTRRRGRPTLHAGHTRMPGTSKFGRRAAPDEDLGGRPRDRERHPRVEVRQSSPRATADAVKCRSRLEGGPIGRSWRSSGWRRARGSISTPRGTRGPSAGTVTGTPSRSLFLFRPCESIGQRPGSGAPDSSRGSAGRRRGLRRLQIAS